MVARFASIVAAVLALSGAAAASGRGGTASPPEPLNLGPGPKLSGSGRLLTDEIGREVRVPQKPARIVSLAPAITESLFAVGAGPQVVGVTRYCDYPKEATTRTIIGGFADPDVERVVSLHPDLVLATADTVTRARFDAIVALGLPVYVVNPRDLAGVASMLRHVGIATGHVEEAEAAAKSFEAAVAAVDARVRDRAKIRALFLFSVEPPIAAGPSTFIDEVLRHAGADNVAANAPTSYPRYGAEGILAAAPAIIFTTVPGSGDVLRKMLSRKEGVIEVDPAILERPGPRLSEGLAAVAAALDAVRAAKPVSSPR